MRPTLLLPPLVRKCVHHVPLHFSANVTYRMSHRNLSNTENIRYNEVFYASNFLCYKRYLVKSGDVLLSAHCTERP